MPASSSLSFGRATVQRAKPKPGSGHALDQNRLSNHTHLTLRRTIWTHSQDIDDVLKLRYEARIMHRESEAWSQISIYVWVSGVVFRLWESGYGVVISVWDSDDPYILRGQVQLRVCFLRLSLLQL